MDQWNQTKTQLLAQIDICMGGRVAEEIMFGTDEVTTGAGSDFDQATRIARLMITKFGMSNKVGISSNLKVHSSQVLILTFIEISQFIAFTEQ